MAPDWVQETYTAARFDSSAEGGRFENALVALYVELANCVGIDLRRKHSHIAALDGHGGELFSRRIVNDPDTFLALLGELDGESNVALEATYSWESLAELLEDNDCELHLAHPLRPKAIAWARVETDAVNARTLAHLLRADLLPEALWRRGSCATCSANGSCSPTCAGRS